MFFLRYIKLKVHYKIINRSEVAKSRCNVIKKFKREKVKKLIHAYLQLINNIKFCVHK